VWLGLGWWGWEGGVGGALGGGLGAGGAGWVVGVALWGVGWGGATPQQLSARGDWIRAHHQRRPYILTQDSRDVAVPVVNARATRA